MERVHIQTKDILDHIQGWCNGESITPPTNGWCWREDEHSRPGEGSCDLTINYRCWHFPLRDELRVPAIPGPKLCLRVPSSPETMLNASDRSPLSRPTTDGTQPPSLSRIHIKEMQAARAPGSPFLTLPRFHTCQRISFYLLPLSATFTPNSFSSLPWLTLLFQSNHSWSDSPK